MIYFFEVILAFITLMRSKQSVQFHVFKGGRKRFLTLLFLFIAFSYFSFFQFFLPSIYNYTQMAI